MHHVKQRLTEHKKVSHCVCVYKEECSQSLIRWFSSSSSSQQQVNFLISDFTARPLTWTKHHDPGPADSLSLLKSTVLSSTDSILSHLQQKVFKCTNWPRRDHLVVPKKKEAVEKKLIICIFFVFYNIKRRLPKLCKPSSGSSEMRTSASSHLSHHCNLYPFPSILFLKCSQCVVL